MMIRMMMMTMTVTITIIVAADADEDETLVKLIASHPSRAPPLFRERVGGYYTYLYVYQIHYHNIKYIIVYVICYRSLCLYLCIF